nr:electron transfer flavoprotein subunit alpha/FixB family protein [Propionibacteriales bacterium]
MSEILVLVDHADGVMRKTTAELLTFARRIGAPAAVFIGSGVEAVRDDLARYGAETVYVADSPELGDYLVAPKAEALAQLVEASSAGAVLIAAGAEGNEIAARLAIKTSSGLI